MEYKDDVRGSENTHTRPSIMSRRVLRSGVVKLFVWGGGGHICMYVFNVAAEGRTLSLQIMKMYSLYK